MNSIMFLKAAYIIAWLVYLGYLGRILLRMRRVEEELKEVTRSSSAAGVETLAPGVQRQRV
jgi:hypothetical protein